MSNAQLVKEAVNLVDIIGERIQLQRSGANLRGLCPFHNEKSPSFFVHEQLQRYRCFGCGAKGDAIDFLINYEKMSFGEALEYLAEKTGVVLQSNNASPEDLEKKELLSILNLAKEYFHYILTQHEVGEPAREYLSARGITAQSIKLFQLGFAPPGWDGLIRFLHHKKKYPLEKLVQAGLVVKNTHGKQYDRFRDRIMFPLKNHRGVVVGFSGRVLNSTEKEAKYINTPETLVYHKSELLYGYSELFEQLKKSDEILVAEGELDVISSAQAHVNNIVAIKGSAFTKQHAELMKRLTTRVVLALDADAAGIKATERALEMLQPFLIEVRVITIPDGKDPDDCARHQPDLWRKTAQSSIPAMEFLINHACNSHDITTATGKASVMRLAAAWLSKLTHVIEKDHYQKYLAQKLEVSPTVIEQDIARFAAGASLHKGKDPAPANLDSNQLDKEPANFKWAVFLLLHTEPTHWKSWVTELESHTSAQTGIMKTLLKAMKESSASTLQESAQNWGSDIQELAFELSTNQEFSTQKGTHDAEKLWADAIKEIRVVNTKNRRVKISQELAKLDAKIEKTPAEEKKQQELLAELVLLR